MMAWTGAAQENKKISPAKLCAYSPNLISK